MNKKIIVWDLFGGGQNSVFKSLDKNIYNVYTFDVTNPTRDKHFFLDLSQKNIIEKLNTFPKPDIIVSSPLCQSFSCVLNMKGGGTCFWKYNSNKTKLVERPVKEFEKLKSGFTKHLKADVQLYLARLGKKCIDNTIEIIKNYKPKYWYIENPKHSLIWKYIKLNRKDFYNEKNVYINEASYGKYGYITTKATFFMSNVRMTLKKGKIEPPYKIVEDLDGKKWYVLKDNPKIKMRKDLDSRMIGISNIKSVIKARNKKLKTGMGAMDFVWKNSKSIQPKDKKTPFQTGEAGPASAIPHSLIKAIFSEFIN